MSAANLCAEATEALRNHAKALRDFKSLIGHIARQSNPPGGPTVGEWLEALADEADNQADEFESGE